MYNELVKTLLQKHFGLPRCSLTVGDTRTPGGRIYYYSFAEERRIAALRDLLSSRDGAAGLVILPELKQELRPIGERPARYPQCAAFRESEDCWTVSFYHITGVRYHSTDTGGVSALLQTDDYPFIQLTDQTEDFFGYWKKYQSRKRSPHANREGFSYWTNKALKTSEEFRAFTVDFFFAVAEAEQRYILKDAARAIANCGCFLPPVSYPALLGFRTPAELIRTFRQVQTALNVDFNKVDLNVGYVMTMLAPEVDRADRKHIEKLDVKTVSDAISLKILYEGFSAEEFVIWYYRKAFADLAYDYDVRMYAADYAQMCLAAGEKLRIGYDLEGLMRAHDDLAARARLKANKKEFEKPLLAVPSKFDALEESIGKTGSTEFERISTTERLFQEGEYQHNCVFSRLELVRRDRAAVYRWNHQGESYTVQFSRDRRGHYAVQEIRARFNRTITAEHLDELRQVLRGIADVGDDLGRGYAPEIHPDRALIRRLDEAGILDISDDELPF